MTKLRGRINCLFLTFLELMSNPNMSKLTEWLDCCQFLFSAQKRVKVRDINGGWFSPFRFSFSHKTFSKIEWKPQKASFFSTFDKNAAEVDIFNAFKKLDLSLLLSVVKLKSIQFSPEFFCHCFFHGPISPIRGRMWTGIKHLSLLVILYLQELTALQQ